VTHDHGGAKSSALTPTRRQGVRPPPSTPGLGELLPSGCSWRPASVAEACSTQEIGLVLDAVAPHLPNAHGQARRSATPDHRLRSQTKHRAQVGRASGVSGVGRQDGFAVNVELRP